ncbi:hypothetical protein Poli38472_011739 [Pythium oligandrum]|uniref:Calponin-homology (CH) domain-containing protein n=1 Tax=Pythium oligandrum TaxID=41045 RepID=A0A8K1C847_PYTOL|nr:hypothetical protein Poli38472_011739 [Pythium oligandrum]|eukprot:TMW58151.1 hypothetical protein Poli38472_011739 [Pythium oligandrum]
MEPLAASSLLRPATPSMAMRTTSLLHVAPTVVEFFAFEFHHEYVANLVVRNASDRALRFRLVPPAPASPFKVLYQGQDLATTSNPTLMLPSGLSIKYEVVFSPPTPQNEAESRSIEHAIVHDALQLRGDDGSWVEVPLVARKAFPEFVVEPSLCEVGLVVLTHRAASLVRVKNVGARPGRFDLEVLDPLSDNGLSQWITVMPTRGVLMAQEELTLKVDVLGKDVGVVRGVIRLRIREADASDQEEEDEENQDALEDTPATLSLQQLHGAYCVEKLIDVCATVMEHTVEFLQSHGQNKVQQLFFGSLFAGEVKTIETILRNNGPQPLFFKTNLTFSGQQTRLDSGVPSPVNGQSDDEREAYERRKELQVYPAEGRVEPFSELLVTFTYRPRAIDWLTLQHMERKQQQAPETLDANDGAGMTQLTAFASILCADLQSQNLTVEVAGKTYLPRVSLTPTSLDFGDIKSHDRVDMLLSLKNLSGLPVAYVIPRVAQFATKPSSGRLDVFQSQAIVVSFVPTQLGSYKTTLEVIIQDGVLTIPLMVKGTAAALGDKSKHDLVGGLMALPQDFEPKYKFVRPEDPKHTKGTLTKPFHRMPPYELAALNGTAAIDEYEFQGTNNTHLTYCVKELAKRADHNAQYHAYLKAQSDKREMVRKKTSAASLKETVSVLRTVSNNNSEDGEAMEMIEDVDMNLGMGKQSGVTPRGLSMPRALKTQQDPLWLDTNAMFSQNPSKKLVFDANKFAKKKFKASPATQAELADCSLSLSFQDLEQIVCGPKTLHFGTLSVNGAAKKSLSVMNALNQNILVALQLQDCEELSQKTALASQVVPPKTLAGFDLVFCSPKEQFFQKPLTVTINGVHTRVVTIVAEVAPIIVALSTQELRFAFSSTDTNASMSLDVSITNPSDSVAPFQWHLLPPSRPNAGAVRPDSSKSSATETSKTSKGDKGQHQAPPQAIYEVVPTSGTLQAGETVRCQVVYTPPSTLAPPDKALYAIAPLYDGEHAASHGNWLVNAFELGIVGGKSMQLTCKGLYQDAKYQLKDKKIDFGTVSVGMHREKHVTLMNTNTLEDGVASRLVFYASIEPATHTHSLGLSVSPAIGSILPQDSCELSVQIAPHKPQNLDNVFLHVQIRGGKSAKLPLLASIVIPEVSITQSVVDYGDVILGVTVSRQLSFENKSNIPACLVLDLTTTPLNKEFTVSMVNSKKKKNAIYHQDDEDLSTIFTPLLPESTDPENGEEDVATGCGKWQICLPASATVSCMLTFTPSAPGSYDVVLPVQFAGLLSAATARPESITRRVQAKAVAPRVRFSSAMLDFDRCVITREGIRKVPYTKTLVLTNTDQSTVKWQIDTTKLKASTVAAAVFAVTSKRASPIAGSASSSAIIFHVAPERGELAPGEEIKVRVSFLPLEPVEYSEDELPLLLDDAFYLHLRLRGVGMHPQLSFSTNKLVLPTVPLGLPSTGRFTIFSTGYDHLEVNFRLPLDVSKAPLTLHFPQGKIVSMACPQIPCEVRFLSKRSVAFHARIEFFDADGNVFHLPIAGCAENCLLTNYTFVDRQSNVETPESLVFYTHPSHLAPIYLLTNKQSQNEIAKAKQKLAVAGSAPPQAPTPGHGLVDVDANGFAGYSEETSQRRPQSREVQFLLQYLNANFLRSPVTHFPQDFAETLGKPLYELLEMVCVKKPPTSAMVGAPPAKPKGGTKATTNPGAATTPSTKERQTQYSTQYGELLKFLKSYGAMLHDVVPEHLLPQELYVRACEDPRADPSILSPVGLSSASSSFLLRRRVLQREWEGVSARAWMAVLYQVIKCFLLFRVTQKSYQQQLQTLMMDDSTSAPVLPAPPAASKATKAPTDRNARTSVASTPAPPVVSPLRVCQGSNVYSEAEMVLLQWLCYHVRRVVHDKRTSGHSSSSYVPESQLLHVPDDLVDGKMLFHVLASHIPTLSIDSSEYRCFRLDTKPGKAPLTPNQLLQQATTLVHAMRCFGVDFGADSSDDKAVSLVTALNAREMVILMLHLYQMLPQFLPKATIEFKGMLGQTIDKTIELKNPSAKLIRYQVFLDTSASSSSSSSHASIETVSSVASEFSIPSNEVVLEPGQIVAFLVRCTPRFSRKATARLVFQSTRDMASSMSSSSSTGATMVFLLESHITSRQPARVITIEAATYEKKTVDVVIENQFLANATYKLTIAQANTTVAGSTSTSLTPSVSGTVGGGGQGRKATKDSVVNRRISSSNSVPTKHETKSEPISAEHAWCIVAQQPFYLPEFGQSVSEIGANNTSVVSLRSQASSTIKVEFLSLVPGTFKCQLLFLDEKVGEFLYEIHATAHLPVTIETLEFQCELQPGAGGSRASTSSHFFKELTVPPKNLQLNKALTTFVDRASGVFKSKLKDGLKKCEETHHTRFAVEFNSPFFTPVASEVTMSLRTPSSTKGPVKASTMASGIGDTSSITPLTSRTDPNSIEMTQPARSDKPSGKANQFARLSTPRGSHTNSTTGFSLSPNVVLIDFQPKNAGVYTCKLLLRSVHTPCVSADWRVYELIAKVKEPNVRTFLDFVAPARHSIVQEIPLSNPSDTAWTLKAMFNPSGGSFSGPSSLSVPAKKLATYPLTFAPKWIIQETTNFVLINPSTQQQFEFELRGTGEEPLAQDHVVLECQARTSLTHVFDVVSNKTDPSGPQVYQVESDLRDVVGASTITVPHPGASAQYALTFSPLVSGTYFGSITFTNLQTKEYHWYTIEATVAPPAPETTLEMHTPVRSVLGVEISLENPLDHTVQFDIELQGRGLLGPSQLTLDAKQSGVYELVYAPLHVTKDDEDGAILFSNSEIGQFWYRLQLRAQEPEPIALDDMSCVVGDVCTQPILLQNPSDQDLSLQYRVTNARNFSIKGDAASSPTHKGGGGGSPSSRSVVRLPPFGNASVVVEYTPSSLSEFEASQVVFYMPGVVSDWTFFVRGKGQAPSLMKPILVQAKVHEAASTLFTFKNPFVDALRLEVQLVLTNGDERQGSTSKSVFDILLKKPRVSLEGFASLQVPISFLPQYVCEARAEIVLRGQDEYAELEWRYPIRGIAEAPLHPKAFVLVCPARDSTEKIIQCELLAAPPGLRLENETITTEWEIDSARFGALATSDAIQRAVMIRPEPVDTQSVSSPRLMIPYRLQFDPLRPYRGSIYLLLNKKSGGRWRFEVVLDVSDPPVDDVLTIESTLNQTSSISFQLRNQFREAAPFQAEFSAGSSSAFTVYPAQGILPAYGSPQGMNFVVSFTPTGYGKMQSGQLLIYTEEMQWTFNVKGTYPDLSASIASKSLSSSASRTRLGIDSVSSTTSQSLISSSNTSSGGSRGGKATSGGAKRR